MTLFPFSNRETPKLAYLMVVMFAFKVDSAKCVDDNLHDFLKMTLQLSDNDYALDDNIIVMILMNATSDSFQHVRNVFQFTGTMSSYDTLCTAMRTKEIEFKKNKSKSALLVKNRNKNQNNKYKSS